MQNEYFSDSQSGDSAPPPVPQTQPTAGTTPAIFFITPKDAEILQQNLEEFRGGSPAQRTKLVEIVMGELCRLRPENAPFDKALAKKV
jgi:hypothetical protein